MKILIAGASGFIGTELVTALEQSHTITVLGRSSKQLDKSFSQTTNKVSWQDLDALDPKQFDVVINLCGSNIGEARWSPKVKLELINSRVSTNRILIQWLINQNAKPRYICANAVGIYGMQTNGDKIVFDENSPIDVNNPKDFLSEIGIAWQQALTPAIDYGMSVTSLRFGVVLQKHKGMLKKLELPFYLGLGSVLGDGEQLISWIDSADLIAAILFILEHPDISGPINLTSPNPVSQRQFAKTFAKVLHRPLIVTTPVSIIKLLFGEMGECLLLKGQGVVPKRLLELGFHFKYPSLVESLNKEYQ
ncbi:MAG: TIGR01777 family oxidoreductase [Legionella sp.]|jgi:hypothetical protein